MPVVTTTVVEQVLKKATVDAWEIPTWRLEHPDEGGDVLTVSLNAYRRVRAHDSVVPERAQKVGMVNLPDVRIKGQALAAVMQRAGANYESNRSTGMSPALAMRNAIRDALYDAVKAAGVVPDEGTVE